MSNREQPADLQRSALKGCVAAMEMQNGRWDESLHIHASVFGPIWDEALNDGRVALAAMNEPPEPSVGDKS